VTSTEDQVRALLHRATPDASPVRFDDVITCVHARRRKAMKTVTASLGVAALTAVAVLLGTQASTGTPRGRSVAAGRSLPPTLVASSTATKSGDLGDGFSFAAPRSAGSAVSAQVALDRSWSSFGRENAPGATTARLTLAYVSRHATHTDVWFVVFEGACIVDVREATYSNKKCIHEPVTDVVDASSGRSLFGYTGEPTMTTSRSTGPRTA
jgi:hypothetical protein